MASNIFAGWEFSKEESIILAIGLVTAGIIIAAGIVLIIKEIVHGIKMYAKGTKKTRRGMQKRAAILMLIILGIVILFNLTS